MKWKREGGEGDYFAPIEEIMTKMDWAILNGWHFLENWTKLMQNDL